MAAKKSKKDWVLPESERGRKIKDEWTFGKQLGQPGQFGVVYLVQNKKTKQLRACKTINKSKFASVDNRAAMYEDMRAEIEVMRSIKHSNVIVLHDVYENKKFLYIIMDNCKGGELFDRIQDEGQISEGSAADIMKQILGALECMHGKKIAHCDLKPDNFLFANAKKSGVKDVVKVIDFGMAKRVKRGKYLSQLCGTPYYTAPEVCGTQPNYNMGADVWSMGVVLFVMLFGFPPFYVDPGYDTRKEAQAIYKLIQKGFDPVVKAGYGAFFPKDLPVSDEARDVIGKMLTTDTVKRPTVTECLAHPWFKKTGTKPLNHLVLKSLSKFHNSCKFKVATLNIFKNMAKKLNSDTVDELKKNFQEMDKNGDGVISYEEFSAQMEKCGNTKEEIDDMFKQVDVDADNAITYEELLMSVTDNMLQSRDERLWEAFCEMDANDDGWLTPDELSAAMTKHSVKMTEDAKTLIEEADKNGDGKVDWEEFMKALSSE